MKDAALGQIYFQHNSTDYLGREAHPTGRLTTYESRKSIQSQIDYFYDYILLQGCRRAEKVLAAIYFGT